MPIERTGGSSSLVEILDRVLDKGIVIDAMVRLSLVGFEVITVEVRVVVASINTFLEYASAVGMLPGGSRPLLAAAPEPVPAAVRTAARKGGAAARAAA
jgi:gas vesicle structural protein